MKERDFQTKFSRWLKYNSTGSGAYELKVTNEPSLPFSDVKEHQIIALKLAKHSKIIHKIADVGMLQKPFDAFCLSQVPAYVVIMFYHHGQKEFFMIDVDEWVQKVENSNRKSLTESEAREIGITCLLA